MSRKVRSAAVVTVCMVAAFIAHGVASTAADKRPVISDGEYAKAWVSCQKMFYDYVFSLGSDWTTPGARGQQGPSGPPPGDDQAASPSGDDQAGPPSGGMGQQVKPTRSNPNPYEQWSPTSVYKLEPKIPVPHYTFSETFSY